MPQAAAFARDTAPAAVFEARAGRPAVAMMMMSAKIAVATERRRIQESIALPKTSEEAGPRNSYMTPMQNSLNRHSVWAPARPGQFEKYLTYWGAQPG